MNIDIKLSNDRVVKQDYKIIGKTFENKATTLTFYLTEEMLDKWFYIEFQKPDGTKVVTPRLEVELDENETGIIKYEILNSLLEQVGTLKAEVVLRTEEDYTWKSFDLKFYIEESINATDELADAYPDFMTDAQKTLDHMNSLEKGKAATVKVNNVETLKPEEEAYIENVGDEYDALFNFGIPKGEKGDLNFATFEIENGYLVMNKPETMKDIDFEIEEGNLVVMIND